MKPILTDDQIGQAQELLARGETRELWGRDRDLVAIISREKVTWRWWVATADGLEFAIDFANWPKVVAGEAFWRAIIMRHFLSGRIALDTARRTSDGEGGSPPDAVQRAILGVVLTGLDGQARILRHQRPAEVVARLARAGPAHRIDLIIKPDDLIRLPRRGARLHWTPSAVEQAAPARRAGAKQDEPPPAPDSQEEESVLDEEPAVVPDDSGRLTLARIEAALETTRRDRSSLALQGDEKGLWFAARRGKGRWVLSQRTPTGSRKRLKIGPWPEVGIEEAAIRARAEKRRFKAKPVTTVADVLARYETQVLRAALSGGPRLRSLKIMLEPLLGRDVNLVFKPDFLRRYDEVAARAPAHANRSLAYVRALLAWAKDLGLAEQNVLARVGKPTHEPRRYRDLSYEELGEIFAAAGWLGHPFGPAYRLMLLTLATREEVASLRLADLSADRTLWTLPKLASDSEPSFQIPLVPPGHEELEAAILRAPAGSDLIFTTNGQTPISGWSRAKRRIDDLIWQARRKKYGERATPMEEWRLYDIRRSFAAWNRVGRLYPKRCVERCLGRTTSFVEPVYREWFFSSDALAMQTLLLEDWSQSITAEAEAWDAVS